MGLPSAGAGWLDRVLTRRRVRDVSIALLVANVVLYSLVVARGRFPFDAQGTLVLPDFLLAHYTGGALALRGGHALYDVEAQATLQRGITGDPRIIDIYLSPPLVAYVYAPFALLPYAAPAMIAWSAWVSLGSSLASARTPSGSCRRSPRGSSRLLPRARWGASQPLIQLFG